MSTASRMLAWLSLAEFLGLTLWFSATAVGPALASEFHLDAAATAWMTMSVQAGFVLGTLASALANLPDVVPVRRLFAAGCLLGAAANAAIVTAGTAGQMIGLRLVTGVALAWVYPPGMKIAAGWFLERRGTALGILIGALTAGSAVPHLLAASGSAYSWRAIVLTASLLAAAAAVVILAKVRDGPFVADAAPFDARAVIRTLTSRGTRLAILGYLGHMWELYAMWAWIAAFASAAGAGQAWAGGGSLVAFLAIASGAVGCVGAGVAADRIGKSRVAGGAMVLSGACAALSGFAFAGPPLLLALLVVIWGITIVADSAQFSVLVAEHSPRDYVGTALTTQTCLGFLLTMASIRLLPPVAEAIGWQWTFLVLVPGPALGVVAMRRLGNGPV